MSAPAADVGADAAAAAAAGAAGRAPRKEKAAVIPSAECILAMELLTVAFRSTLSLPAHSSAASAEVTYPEKAPGVPRPSRDFEHKEKATISLAYPGELTPEQLQAIEDAANTHIKRAEHSALHPLKFIKPKRTKAKDGYELTFVIGQTGKTLVAKTEADRAKVNSKKVGAGVAADPSAATPAAAAASPSSSASASAAAAASSSSASAAAPAAVAVVSTDYVRATTDEVFHELALASFAKLQLLQSFSSSPSSVPALPSATDLAGLLTKDQLGNMLTKDQMKSKPSPADILGFLGAERIVSVLTPQQLEQTLPKEQQAFFAKELMPSLQAYMISFANEAYTRGFTAAKKGNGGINIAQLL